MKYLQILFLFLGLVLNATEVDNSYQIVYSDSGNDPVLNHFDKIAAQLFARGAKEGANITLPVISEKEYRGGKAIFIGNTKAAQKLGINPVKLSYNSCAVETDSKQNLYFSGRHSCNPEYPKIKGHRFRELGTLYGVCVFLREYAGMRAFLPGAVKFKAQKKFSFPDHLKTVYIPNFLYVHGTPSWDPIYDCANGFIYAPWHKSYGGHSHDKAVPVSLFKTHPEFFYLSPQGNRYRGNLCLSNKNVQERIYQELISRLDKGFEWVQLGQCDGFSGCNCKSCKELFGVTDWGEKLWLLHLNMSQRLKKDRPGKKVVILSYHVTAAPPQTFQEFPDNVIIELCSYSRANLLAWQKITVPGGFVAYTYNWGVYAPSGFSPNCTVEKAIEQIKLFKEFNIKAIFRTGFGHMYGLEGPTYYAYGVAINGLKNQNSEQVLSNYCHGLYGKAAEYMKEFFTELYNQQKLNLSKKDTFFDNLGGRFPGGYSNHYLLSMRYPAQVISKLNTLLEKSEGLEVKNKYISLVRKEFNFMAATAELSTAFCAYLEKKDFTTLKKLEQRVEFRNKLLKNIRQWRNWNDGIPAFGTSSDQLICDGGNYKGKIIYPVVWDFDFLLRESILPGKRELVCGGAPQKLLPATMDKVNEEMIKVRAEKKQFGLEIILTDHDMKTGDLYQIFLDNILFALRCNSHNAGIYGKHSSGSFNLKKEFDRKLTKVTRAGNELTCFIPEQFLPAPLKNGIPFNIYVRRKAKGRKYIFEPDIYVLKGENSIHNGRGTLITNKGEK